MYGEVFLYNPEIREPPESENKQNRALPVNSNCVSEYTSHSCIKYCLFPDGTTPNNGVSAPQFTRGSNRARSYTERMSCLTLPAQCPHNNQNSLASKEHGNTSASPKYQNNFSAYVQSTPYVATSAPKSTSSATPNVRRIGRNGVHQKHPNGTASKVIKQRPQK